MPLTKQMITEQAYRRWRSEGPCGWLKDKFGLSWQVVPTAIPRMMGDPDSRKSAHVMNAFIQMKKLDFAALERAYAGQAV